MSELSFKKLRQTNVKRCRAVFHPLKAWSLTDWSCAMAGETGEACNIAKKLKRLEESDANFDTPKYRRKLKREFAKEIADVVIYADLLAAAAGINLAEAVRDKFNEVSDRRGSKIKL
jgi:NTP pyrophosphatase (non-canonical NTP hydrolase)